MYLEDLEGQHTLTGIGSLYKRIDAERDQEDSQVFSFELDGIIYSAIEDPNDGYRSSLRSLVVDVYKIDTQIPPTKVVAKMKYKNEEMSYFTEECIILQFFDVNNNKLILEIGTGRTDEHYPYFVANWYPRNLHLN